MTVPKVTYQRQGDSRELCFTQGKVCVYRDDDGMMVAEWPNGVISRKDMKTDKIVRTWPDGRVEHYEAGDPKEYEVPILPRAI